MNEHSDVIGQVRESFAELRMDTPVEQVFARSRTRRRRRSAVTVAAAGAVGAAAAITLTFGGPVPSRSGNLARPRHDSATLAAFSVTGGPDGSTTLILVKGPQHAQLDPAALRQALTQHGIPALVTVGTFCRTTTGSPVSFDQFVHPATLPDGSAEMIINGAAMPTGTQLSIGYFPNFVRMAVVEDGAALSCSSLSVSPRHTAVLRAAPSEADRNR
jgi:hypothetical protein